MDGRLGNLLVGPCGLLLAAIAAAIAAWTTFGTVPCARGEQERGDRSVTFAATGDVLFHGPVLAAARLAEPDAARRVFAGLAAALGDDEIAFANLEVPLTTAYARPRGGRLPVIGGSAAVAEALASAGIDVVSVANNHAYDQGTRGVLDTLEALRAAGVASVGAGPDQVSAHRPWIADRGSLRVAFLAFTQPMNRAPGRSHPSARVARLEPLDRATAAIADARARADLLVVSVHWGADFQHAPTSAQRDLARRLVDAGADLVLGTGPHVLHQVERIRSPRGEAIVAYSLGNLISPQGYLHRSGRRVRGHPAAVDPRAREGVVLGVDAQVSDSGEVTFTDLRARPLWTHNNYLSVVGGGQRPEVRVIPLADAAAEGGRWESVASALGPAVRLVR